ncbi:F420-dependent glucose-6-phosphate dehydrogenase [Trichinella pseudospiralis]
MNAARTRQKPPIDTGVSSPSVDRSRGRSPVGLTNEPARESDLCVLKLIHCDVLLRRDLLTFKRECSELLLGAEDVSS